MPLRLDSQSADFSTRFRAFLAVKREAAQDVEQSVRRILAEVKAHGDRALLQLTLEFDRLDLSKVSMRVSADEIEAAAKSCEPQALAALKLARARIEAYHLRQKPSDERFTDALGVEMGSRWTAIEAVGLYVPGGTAAYPSSVLMNAVPAKVAGCARLVMVVPAPDGKLSALVLAAAKLAGVDEIYRIGGAQAILITDDAALADQVEKAVESQLKTLPRAKVAGASWRDFGAIITVATLADAVALVDQLAPEHLEIAAENAETLVSKIRNAGAIFIGAHTPEAIGDYVAGSNHVLPTARSARF